MTAPKPTLSTATAEEIQKALEYAHYLKEFRKRKKENLLVPRSCKYCGKDFLLKRIDKIFCGDKCRTNHGAREFAERYRRMEVEIDALHVQCEELRKERNALQLQLLKLKE